MRRSRARGSAPYRCCATAVIAWTCAACSMAGPRPTGCCSCARRTTRPATAPRGRYRASLPRRCAVAAASCWTPPMRNLPATIRSLQLLERFDNVVVLRTLSKAMALAGVRCGVLLGVPRVVDLLSCVLPPYTFPVRVRRGGHAVPGAGEFGGMATPRGDCSSRSAGGLAAALKAVPGITRVWPSDANFILVEAADPRRLVTAARAGRRADPRLQLGSLPAPLRPYHRRHARAERPAPERRWAEP